MSDPGEAAKKGKVMTEQERWEEMKAMFAGLSNQVAGVSKDIVEVNKDLGLEIQKSRQETQDLRARMDYNDKNFDTRVTAVLTNLGFGAAGSQPPTGSGQDGGPSPSGDSSVTTYASCAASIPSPAAAEDPYWLCRRS